jgi:hypothetical protein
VHFQNAFYQHFSKCIFKTHFFTCFHIFVKNVKECELKMRLGKMWKCGLTMWKNVKNVNKRQLKSSCFLAPFVCFFSGFLWILMLNFRILNLNIRIPHKHIFMFNDSCQ